MVLMTQPSLPGIPGPPPATILRIELEDLTQSQLVDGTLLTVRMGSFSDVPTIAAHRFVGLEADYLDTVVQEVVHAWHYSPHPAGAAMRAVQVNARRARRHARDYART